MQRILHIPNYYNPHIGGIEQAAEDVVNSLKGLYEQKIICFKDAKKTTKDIVNGVEVTRVSCCAKISSQSIAPSYKKELRRMFKEYKPDIVIFHYPNPFVAHILLKLLKKHKNVKLLLFWHTDIVKQKLLMKFFHKQNLKLINRANKIIATSPNYVEGSKYLSLVKDKISIVPLCATIHSFDLEKKNKIVESLKNEYVGKHIIFGFGRHVEYKGFKYLVESTKYLPDDYICIIGGNGPLTDELKETSSNNFKVLLPGRLSNEEIEAYFELCEVFAFPSITKNEAFGIALAEALLHGVPAVTFNIPGSGVNYVNMNNETGLEVPNCDAKAYAEAIMKIVDDTELKNTFSINAKERANSLFSVDTFNNNIISLISNMLK